MKSYIPFVLTLSNTDTKLLPYYRIVDTLVLTSPKSKIRKKRKKETCDNKIEAQGPNPITAFEMIHFATTFESSAIDHQTHAN